MTNRHHAREYGRLLRESTNPWQRGSRAFPMIVDWWGDGRFSRIANRSWKRYRNTQYKVVQA